MGNRDKKGRFVKGNRANPKGRPGTSIISQLKREMKNIETEEGRESLLRHYIRQAYEDNTILAGLMSKLIPTLKSVDANVTQEHRGAVTITWRRPEPRPKDLKSIDEITGSQKSL